MCGSDVKQAGQEADAEQHQGPHLNQDTGGTAGCVCKEGALSASCVIFLHTFTGKLPGSLKLGGRHAAGNAVQALASSLVSTG